VIDRAVESTGNRPARVIHQLFLTALGRPPSADELLRLRRHVADQRDLRAGYSDILWALLNSSEFTMIH
jgi:hypothetical protein